jgi:uncharacterized membrane protein
VVFTCVTLRAAAPMSAWYHAMEEGAGGVGWYPGWGAGGRLNAYRRAWNGLPEPSTLGEGHVKNGQRGWRRALAGAVVWGALAGATQAQAAGSLTMVDLGVAPGDFQSIPTAINASGVVIGFGRGTDDIYRPWISANGVITRPAGIPDRSSFSDINDSGLIVGDEPGGKPITYQDGVITQLKPALGDNFAEALAVDNDGTVAGMSGLKHGGSVVAVRTVVWAPGTIQPTVLDIFDPVDFPWQQPNAFVAGRIVGDAPTDTTVASFVWQGGVVTTLHPRPADLYAVATSISAKGVVAGWVRDADIVEYPARWNRKGTVTVLPTFPPAAPPHPAPVYGHANAISPNGVPVGESRQPNGVIHAVAWPGGQLVDLGSDPRLDSFAIDATTKGRIVGFARIGSTAGEVHAVVWTLKGKGPGTPVS